MGRLIALLVAVIAIAGLLAGVTTLHAATREDAASPLFQYVVIQQNRYRTDLAPPLVVQVVTGEVLEWPTETSSILLRPGTPKIEARLRVVVSGAASGVKIPTQATRTCTTYGKYSGSSATTKHFALTLRAGAMTALPAVIQSVHDHVGCSWILRFTINGTRRPVLTIYAPAVMTPGYEPDVLTPNNTPYDREMCSISDIGGSQTRSCKPIRG